MRRPTSLPPGLTQLVVAALGALAIAVGLVAAVSGRGGGIAIAFGGGLLLLWSVYGRKLRR